MKTNVKRIVSSILTMVVMASLCVPMTFAHAAEEEDVVTLVQEDLRVQNSSISEELDDLLAEYKRQAVFAAEETERMKFEELALGVEAVIENYNAALNWNTSSASTRDSDAVHALTVAAVLAYFNGNRYYLSGELLTRASMNTDTNYIYTPTYASVIQGSRAVSAVIRSGMPYGSGEITYSDTPDGYYAVHLFNYQKQGSRYVITDVYDFELGDQSYPDNISGVAVNAMARAQEDGYLVPYTVWINC